MKLFEKLNLNVKAKVLPGKLHNVHFFYEEPLVYDFPHISTVDKAYFYNFLKHFFFDYKIRSLPLDDFCQEFFLIHDFYEYKLYPYFENDFHRVPHVLYSNPAKLKDDHKASGARSNSPYFDLPIDYDFYVLEYPNLKDYFVYDYFLPINHPHYNVKTIILSHLIFKVDQLYTPFKELISEEDFCFLLEQLFALTSSAECRGYCKVSFVTKNHFSKAFDLLVDWQPSFLPIWQKTLETVIKPQVFCISNDANISFPEIGKWEKSFLPLIEYCIEHKHIVLAGQLIC